MIDFEPVRAKRIDLSELARGLGEPELAAATKAMTAELLRLLEGCRDADVTFVPVDPEANDRFTDDPAHVDLAWTLGHVIVHVTASSEEGAFLGAELARGVEAHGRSRYEVPWPSVTTIETCRERLRESNRMILATLDAWPDEPHLDVFYTPPSGSAPRNAVARLLGGLSHADSHRAQIAEIIRQAHAAGPAADEGRASR